MQYTNGEFTGTDKEISKHLGASIPKAHPENWPAGPWTEVVPDHVVLTPEQVLSRQRAIIRNDAEISYREPVTMPDATIWNGGFDSAQAINSAAEMAAFLSLSTVSIFDSSNTEHVVTITEAKTVAAGIGADYQTKFAAKQAAMRALADVDLTAPDAIDRINAIEFANYLPAPEFA